MIYALIGKAVVVLLAVAVALWLPLVPAFGIGWICYKTGRCLAIRDKSVAFVAWYADHVLKPIFDPVLG